MKKVLFHFLCLVLLAFATRPRYASKYVVDTTNPRVDSTKQYRQQTSHFIERGSSYDTGRHEARDDKYNDDAWLTNNEPPKDSEHRIEDRNLDDHRDIYAINKSYLNESQKVYRRRELENKRTDSKNGETQNFQSEWYTLKKCKCLADEITSDVRPSELNERRERRTHVYEVGDNAQNNFRRKYYDMPNKRDVNPEKIRSNYKENKLAASRPTQKEDLSSKVKKGHSRTIILHITTRPKVKNAVFNHRRTHVSKLREMANEEEALEAQHEINEVSTRKSEQDTRFENNHKELLSKLNGALSKLGHEVKKLSVKFVDHEKALEQHEKRLDLLESNITQEMEKIRKRDIIKTTKTNSERKDNYEPPPYDGTTSFSAYIEQFEEMAYENVYSKEKALTTLISALRDKALEVLDSVGDDFTYEELVDALSIQFAKNIAEPSPRDAIVRDEGLSEDSTPPELRTGNFNTNINLRSKEVNSETEDRRVEEDNRPFRNILDFQPKYAERPSSEIEDRNDGSERDNNSKVINVEMELVKKST